jgi:hypothetical protein
MKVPFEEMAKVMAGMREFQKVHNLLRIDFLKIYESVKESEATKFQDHSPLIRACIKELFSLIEADIFLYNQWNPYPGFYDRHSLDDKFKKTFKHHAETFPDDGRIEAYQKFMDRDFSLFKMVEEIRHHVTHPKGEASVRVDFQTLDQARKLYDVYTVFVQSMFTNVMISITGISKLK